MLPTILIRSHVTHTLLNSVQFWKNSVLSNVTHPNPNHRRRKYGYSHFLNSSPVHWYLYFCRHNTVLVMQLAISILHLLCKILVSLHSQPYLYSQYSIFILLHAWQVSLVCDYVYNTFLSEDMIHFCENRSYNNVRVSNTLLSVLAINLCTTFPFKSAVDFS